MEMKRTLTDYGMKFIEIPRKKFDGEVISASRVRKLLSQGKLEDIKKMVPAATYEFLLR
jgi:citrate lyase synthetase